MSLQTGGLPCGAISTRSRSASWPSWSAWSVGTMPTVSPLGPTSRTSGTRIRSLMRSSVLMCPPWVERWGTATEASGNDESPRATRGGSWCDVGMTTCVTPTVRTEPDDLVRSVRVGVSLHLSARARLSTKPDRSVTRLSTPALRCLFRNLVLVDLLDQGESLTRVGEHPSAGLSVYQFALDDLRRGPREVAAQRRRPCLQSRHGHHRRRDGHRTGVGPPCGQRRDTREAQHRLTAVTARDQDGGHVTGLLGGQSPVVDLDLAGHGEHGHQQACVLEGEQLLERAPPVGG